MKKKRFLIAPKNNGRGLKKRPQWETVLKLALKIDTGKIRGFGFFFFRAKGCPPFLFWKPGPPKLKPGKKIWKKFLKVFLVFPKGQGFCPSPLKFFFGFLKNWPFTFSGLEPPKKEAKNGPFRIKNSRMFKPQKQKAHHPKAPPRNGPHWPPPLKYFPIKQKFFFNFPPGPKTPHKHFPKGPSPIRKTLALKKKLQKTNFFWESGGKKKKGPFKPNKNFITTKKVNFFKPT